MKPAAGEKIINHSIAVVVNITNIINHFSKNSSFFFLTSSIQSFNQTLHNEQIPLINNV
jgi:hypothetical protein